MKIYLDMVGCRLNQSELEGIAQQFLLAGHSLASTAESADMIVINTCTVTSAAASDSRQMIRQASRSGARQIVVTGCWATLNQQAAAGFPKVSHVIANADKVSLVSTVLDLPVLDQLHTSASRQPIPGKRQRTRAFIKVQDGCSNTCTYCITRLARGAAVSRDIQEVMGDVHSALEGGALEIVLSGVHLGSWGYDFSPPAHLSRLVSILLSQTKTSRLRLSSLEPWDIPDDFFELWQDPRLCRHLHLPLQSGCEATLRRMGRRITPKAFADILTRARNLIPGVAITTDIITGFPGETEAEFAESLAFINRMDFAGAHIFTYSAMPGTAAARLPNKVPYELARQRHAQVRKSLQDSATAYRQKQVGLQLQVLWEKATPTDDGRWQLNGLSDNYQRVHASFPSPCHNQIMDVYITGVEMGELAGIISGV